MPDREAGTPANKMALAEQFAPVLADIEERAMLVERFIDRDLYRLYITTLWANIVLEPGEVGLTEDDLEVLHDVINDHVAQTIGPAENLTECFRFINSKPGEQAMAASRLTKNHKDLLLYFASMILDPDGHKRWMADVEDRLDQR